MELGDAAAIAILMAEHPLWQNAGLVERAAIIEHRLRGREYGLVAEMQDGSTRRMDGFIMMADGTFGDHGYIRILGVRSGEIGRGLGARLLHEGERTMHDRGMQAMFLLCTDWNGAAQAFYERHGYRRVGALPDWLFGGVSEYIYVKR